MMHVYKPIGFSHRSTTVVLRDRERERKNHAPAWVVLYVLCSSSSSSNSISISSKGLSAWSTSVEVLKQLVGAPPTSYLTQCK